MRYLENLEKRQLMAVNLLGNGNFESPLVGAGASGQGYTDYSAGQVLGSVWKVGTGSADIVTNTAGTTYTSTPASGKQYVDMAGFASGSISQTATTVANHRYILRFAYTATPFGPTTDLRKMDVNFGSVLVTSISKSVGTNTPTKPGWAYKEYLVTATSASTVVKFTDKGTTSLGMALDNVSLTEVPFGTASIGGQVFADGNGDGIKGTDAIGLSSWTVYIDTNGNGVLDTNEIHTTTDHLGNYSIKNLAAGTYKVRVVQQTNWKLTSAAILSITLTTGQSATSKLFGEQPI